MKHQDLFLVVILNVVSHVSANVGRVNDAINLNSTTQEKFDKFKARVMPQLTQPYMMTDTYLIRWMRAKDYNELEAEAMLLKSLQWRKDENMDTVHNEDWSDFKRDYPVISAKDRDGRPTILFLNGYWDISKFGFGIKTITRYYASILDKASLLIFEMQKNGSNLTRWIDIFDQDKLSYDKHMCFSCGLFYLAATTLYEDHYPQLSDRIVMINTPTFFDVTLNVMKGAMAPDSRDALKIYGTDRVKWEAEMAEWIDTTQIPGWSTIKNNTTAKPPVDDDDK